jgi:Zn-dependent protease with chaperone function
MTVSPQRRDPAVDELPPPQPHPHPPARSFLGRVVTRIADGVLPRCPVSGRRCLLPIPHVVDRMLGGANFFFYKLSAPRSIKELELNSVQNPEMVSSDQATLAQLRQSRQISAAQTAQAVFDRLKPQVPTWPVSVWDLNPWADNHREWQLLVEGNDACNAFALPGGKIVVFDGILQKIWDRVKAKQLAVANGGTWTVTTQVRNQDRQLEQVTLDLSSVKYEDVVAALIGHEMTHVAARHGIFRILVTTLLSLALNLLVALLAAGAQRQSRPVDRRMPMDHLLFGLMHLINACADFIVRLLTLSLSRSNEYEADRYGMKIARNGQLNPLGALALQELFESMQPEDNFIRRVMNVFSTHPSSAQRIGALVQELKDNREFERVYQGALLVPGGQAPQGDLQAQTQPPAAPVEVAVAV